MVPCTGMYAPQSELYEEASMMGAVLRGLRSPFRRMTRAAVVVLVLAHVIGL